MYVVKGVYYYNKKGIRMLYVASILLVLMVVVLITCGVLLWKRREETGDHSRSIQAILSWISAFFAFMFMHTDKTQLTGITW